MTPPYGIDTSILMRLITRQPESDFERCVAKLTALVEDEGAEVFASNQVIGEAYVGARHHYGLPSDDVRAALLGALQSGLVAPLNGRAVLDALSESAGPGLFDRLIADGYARAGVETLTLDRKMAALPGVREL